MPDNTKSKIVSTKSNNPTREKMGLGSAVLMGLGGMIGAGIFVLLGEAGAVAGSAVWLSFLMAGIIALLTGYSYGKLSARYPSAGGVVEFLTQGYGVGVFSGAVSVLYYLAQVIGISMLASSFGIYGAPLLFGPDASHASVSILGSVLLVAITLVNFVGSKTVTRAESLIVGINVIILMVFTVPALTQVELHLLAPSTYPPAQLILTSLAFTFFAFTGFGIITNTAEDIEDPKKNLPRAMMLSIGIVMVLYIAIALAVFGTLPVDKVVAAKNTALAVAAEPILGHMGFVLVSLSAMLATASAINASLYGTTNQTYLLAKDGELPQGFGRRMWKQGTEGLAITMVLALIVANTLDLTAIASLASITILIVYLLVNVGHLRLTRETGARRVVILLATLTCFATLALFLYHVFSTAPKTGVALLIFIAAAFIGEILLQKTRHRTIRPRGTDKLTTQP
jgi:amino acid transporter